MKKVEKISKILSAIVLTSMLIMTFTNVFAAGEGTDVTVMDPGKWSTGTYESKVNTAGISDWTATIINVISIVGSAAAIIFLIVLGIKYMMGSAEEKAEYKKTLMPYVIGAIMVFGASALTGFIYHTMKG